MGSGKAVLPEAGRRKIGGVNSGVCGADKAQGISGGIFHFINSGKQKGEWIMKKISAGLCGVLLFVCVLAGCGASEDAEGSGAGASSDSSAGIAVQEESPVRRTDRRSLR